MSTSRVISVYLSEIFIKVIDKIKFKVHVISPINQYGEFYVLNNNDNLSVEDKFIMITSQATWHKADILLTAKGDMNKLESYSILPSMKVRNQAQVVMWAFLQNPNLIINRQSNYISERFYKKVEKHSNKNVTLKYRLHCDDKVTYLEQISEEEDQKPATNDGKGANKNKEQSKECRKNKSSTFLDTPKKLIDVNRSQSMHCISSTSNCIAEECYKSPSRKLKMTPDSRSSYLKMKKSKVYRDITKYAHNYQKKYSHMIINKNIEDKNVTSNINKIKETSNSATSIKENNQTNQFSQENVKQINGCEKESKMNISHNEAEATNDQSNRVVTSSHGNNKPVNISKPIHPRLRLLNSLKQIESSKVSVIKEISKVFEAEKEDEVKNTTLQNKKSEEIENKEPNSTVFKAKSLKTIVSNISTAEISETNSNIKASNHKSKPNDDIERKSYTPSETKVVNLQYCPLNRVLKLKVPTSKNEQEKYTIVNLTLQKQNTCQGASNEEVGTGINDDTLSQSLNKSAFDIFRQIEEVEHNNKHQSDANHAYKTNTQKETQIDSSKILYPRPDKYDLPSPKEMLSTSSVVYKHFETENIDVSTQQKRYKDFETETIDVKTEKKLESLHRNFDLCKYEPKTKKKQMNPKELYTTPKGTTGFRHIQPKTLVENNICYNSDLHNSTATTIEKPLDTSTPKDFISKSNVNCNSIETTDEKTKRKLKTLDRNFDFCVEEGKEYSLLISKLKTDVKKDSHSFIKQQLKEMIKQEAGNQPNLSKSNSTNTELTDDQSLLSDQILLKDKYNPQLILKDCFSMPCLVPPPELVLPSELVAKDSTNVNKETLFPYWSKSLSPSRKRLSQKQKDDFSQQQQEQSRYSLKHLPNLFDFVRNSSYYGQNELYNLIQQKQAKRKQHLMTVKRLNSIQEQLQQFQTLSDEIHQKIREKKNGSPQISLHETYEGMNDTLTLKTNELKDEMEEQFKLITRVDQQKLFEEMWRKVQVCVVCDRVGVFMVCTSCKTVYYCSKQCQSTDWNNKHQDKCNGDLKKSS